MIRSMFAFRYKSQRPVIYCPSGNQGWIIDAIAKDINQYHKGSLVRIPKSRREIFLHLKNLITPRSKINVFAHHRLFISMMLKSQVDLDARNIVYFCHHTPSLNPEKNDLIMNLKYASKIIVMSSQSKNFLISKLGRLHEKKIFVVIGGADLEKFSNLECRKNTKSVIMVIHLAARKRPDLLLRTVKDNRDFTFILHGRSWKESVYLKSLRNLPNFEFHCFDFSNANRLFNSANIFLSLSDLEGGPIPALEALASGCKVILTNTGWAEDLAKLTNSVIVIPTNPSQKEVREALIYCQFIEPPPKNIVDFFAYGKFLKEFL
jgi:glycosyltransferase involved in cell wall biosynthesis